MNIFIHKITCPTHGEQEARTYSEDDHGECPKCKHEKVLIAIHVYDGWKKEIPKVTGWYDFGLENLLFGYVTAGLAVGVSVAVWGIWGVHKVPILLQISSREGIIETIHSVIWTH